MANARFDRSILALAASAVAAVYVAGYARTASADAALGAALPTPPAVTAPLVRQPPALAPTAPPPASAARQTDTSPSLSGAAGSPTGGDAPSATLKDGTFTGVGTSRRGDVQVALTVQGGRIAGVTITRASTQYPTRFIANLPGEVVSRQSAQVDIVGGATYSSVAFRSAVQQALQRART